MTRGGRRVLVTFATVVTLAGGALLVVGVTRTRAAGSSPAERDAAIGTSATAAGSPCATGPWGCEQEQRFQAANALIKKKAGYLGIVVRDRRTGAVWQAGTPTHPTWTASTIKLAMATGLLERDRSGEISLDAKARQQIADMLAFSSNEAADALWFRYGEDAMVEQFRSLYGMRGLTFVAGFDRYWGLMKCTATDLAALMAYILEKLNAADRTYLITAMRGVQPIQRWGVWAAGAPLQPGVKDGWSVEKDTGGDHWVINTVGFAGDNQRYVVAAMYHLPPKTGTLKSGVHAVSDLIATVFGQPVPAPAVIPAHD